MWTRTRHLTRLLIERQRQKKLSTELSDSLHASTGRHTVLPDGYVVIDWYRTDEGYAVITYNTSTRTTRRWLIEDADVSAVLTSLSPDLRSTRTEHSSGKEQNDPSRTTRRL